MGKTSRRNLLKGTAVAGVSAALGLTINPEIGAAGEKAGKHQHATIAGPLANATVSFGAREYLAERLRNYYPLAIHHRTTCHNWRDSTLSSFRPCSAVRMPFTQRRRTVTIRTSETQSLIMMIVFIVLMSCHNKVCANHLVDCGDHVRVFLRSV